MLSASFRVILSKALMRTKEPSFRVTREITYRGKKIPIQAECSACADAEFKLNIDKRKTYHEPDRESYLLALKRKFDAHLKVVHAPDSYEQ